MWFYLIFSIVSLIALIVIFVVFARLAPRTSLIDTENVPEERATQKKKEIINERFNRALRAQFERAKDKIAPLFSRIHEWGKGLFQHLLNIERRLERRVREQKDLRAYVEELMVKATAAMEAGDTGEAEKKLVEVISIDAKHESAYRMLGDLYLDNRQLQEAWEVLTFLLKLTLRNACGPAFVHADTGIRNATPVTAQKLAQTCTAEVVERTEIAKQYARLGEVAQSITKGSEALAAFEHAVAFEPANPRYLDLLIEACILEKQKKRAKEVLASLREVNPENQKLGEFAEKIAELK